MADLRERREFQKAARLDYFSREGEVVRGVLHGELPTKSNQRRIFNGRSIKSQKALDFVERVKLVASYCIGQVGHPFIGATTVKDMRRGVPFIYLKTTVYGDSLMRDLDVELLCDALQHAGLINNDKALRPKFSWWGYDPENPRVEFELGYADRLDREGAR